MGVKTGLDDGFLFALLALFETAFSAQDDQTIRSDIRRVGEIGSTSGIDMLTGIMLALRQHIGGGKS